MKKFYIFVFAILLLIQTGWGAGKFEGEKFVVLFHTISFPNYVEIVVDEERVFEAQLKDGLEHTWLARVLVSASEFEFRFRKTPTWQRVSGEKIFSKKVKLDISKGKYIIVSCGRNGKISVQQSMEIPKLL